MFDNVEPLPTNPRRVATPTLRGYAYQVWVTLEQWLRMPSGITLFLEGAEDIDRIAVDEAESIQIRHTASSISLNTNYAREAIKNFWTVQEREHGSRTVQFQYLTTSIPAVEVGSPFGNVDGISVWTRAAHDAQAANSLRAYLLKVLNAEGSLLDFLRDADITELQSRLFSRFRWVTGAEPYDSIKEIVIDSLSKRLDAGSTYTRPSLEQIVAQLLSYCWERICNTELHDRTLTYQALASEIDKAGRIHFSLPATSVGSFMAATSHLAAQGNISALALLVTEPPQAPYPLLERHGLFDQVYDHLNVREAVLLTGSVFKGKTTLAILAAKKIDPAAWWIELGDRPAQQVREILNLLYWSIDSPTSPQLVVLDDLNTDSGSRAIYDTALKRFLLKTRLNSKSVLITARGTFHVIEKEVVDSWNVRKIDVTAMSADEISEHCTEYGCSDPELSIIWSKVISAQTSGHPRLVQVHIRELAEKGWNFPRLESFVEPSTAVQNAQQLARISFRERYTEEEAAYVYTAAEFSVSPTREMLIKLADEMNVTNTPGDLIARLEGKWIETVSSSRYRVTPVLKAIRGETWSDATFRRAHVNVFDSISDCKLTPSDGAALVFHAYVAGEPERLAVTCAKLSIITDQEIRTQAFKHLSWILAVTAPSGKSVFPSSPLAAATLRQLQFQVAEVEQTEDINPIIEGWLYEIGNCPKEIEGNFRQVLNYTVLISNARILPSRVLSCAASIDSQGSIATTSLNATFDQLLNSSFSGEIPEKRTAFQSYIAIKRNFIYDFLSLTDFVQWIGSCSEPDLLESLDSMVEWPLVRMSGSFIHASWASNAPEKHSWEKWISVLEIGFGTCASKRLMQLGVEFARAISIIQTEYLNDLKAGLGILDLATNTLGQQIGLMEQLLNCHFHAKSYSEAHNVWNAIEARSRGNLLSDPYTYRRAALAAIGIGDVRSAARIFMNGADAQLPVPYSPLKCAYIAEAALAYSRIGEMYAACKLMLQCFEQLPPVDQQLDPAQWQAVVRTLTVLTAQIRGLPQAYGGAEGAFVIEPGFISAPALKLKQVDNLQAMRHGALEIEVLSALIEFGDWSETHYQKLRKYLSSQDPMLKMMSAINLICLELRFRFSADYIEHVESLISAMDEMHKKSPFASNGQKWDLTRLGYYIIAIAKWDLNLTAFTNVIEEARNKSEMIEAASIHQLFTAANESNLNRAFIGVIESKEPIDRTICALIVHTTDVHDPQIVTISQAVLSQMFFLTGPFVMLKHRNAAEILAESFSNKWNSVLRSTSRLRNPAFTVPALIQTIKQVRQGRASVPELLSCAAIASGVDLDSLIEDIGNKINNN